MKKTAVWFGRMTHGEFTIGNDTNPVTLTIHLGD